MEQPRQKVKVFNVCAVKKACNFDRCLKICKISAIKKGDGECRSFCRVCQRSAEFHHGLHTVAVNRNEAFELCRQCRPDRIFFKSSRNKTAVFVPVFVHPYRRNKGVISDSVNFNRAVGNVVLDPIDLKRKFLPAKLFFVLAADGFDTP